MSSLSRFFPWNALALSLTLTSALYAGGDEGEETPPPAECPAYTRQGAKNILLDADYTPQVNPLAPLFQFHAFYERSAVKDKNGKVIDCEYPVYQWVLLEQNFQCVEVGACMDIVDCRGCWVGSFVARAVVHVGSKTYGVQKIGMSSLKNITDRILSAHYYDTFLEGLETDNFYGAISKAGANEATSTEDLFGTGEFIFTIGNVSTNGESEWKRLFRLNPSISNEARRESSAKEKIQKGGALIRPLKKSESLTDK